MMGGFSFLHPMIAAGVIGVAAPIIIHFFFRRRAKVMEFPPMRFVLMSYKKVARKLLLQEYLLLATRCAMAALLALGLAGPLMSRVVQGIKRGERPVAAVFVIDTSMSMTRKRSGDPLAELAKKDAREWLGQLTDSDRAAVIDAVTLKGVGLTDDLDKVGDAVDRMNTSYAPARMAEAVSLASSWLEGPGDIDRMIVVFTDLQKTGWDGGAGPEEGAPPLVMVDVSEDMPAKNLSVSNLRIDWRSLAREDAAELVASIANHGVEDARQILVRVESGEQVLAQGFADVKAGEEQDKRFVLTDTPGGAGRVTLPADDGMAGDNTAWFHMKGGEQVAALVVDGDPGSSYIESETYFLDHALNPRLYAKSRVNPRPATPYELDDIDLSEFPVVILANVGKLDKKAVEKIKTFVHNGGGLLITLGDRVDADVYNALWGDLLPRELRGVKLAYAGAAGSSDVRVMHLETPTGDDPHPILSVFRDPAKGDLGLSGFWKYFLMQQEVVPRSKVILRLTDGVPVMVEGSYGSGRVIVLASTVDRAWSDMCIHPTFLPLMQQTVQYLAGALVEKNEGGMVAGRLIEVPVAGEVTGARVLGPDGKINEAELVEEEGARRVRITHTALPGVYLVRFTRKGQDKSTTITEKEADRILVLNVDPKESDLTRIDKAGIEARTGAAVSVISPGAPLDAEASSTVEKKSYAGAFLMMLVALAVLERALVRKG